MAAPYRSLAAPYEEAFLINDFLRKRGVPAKVDIVTAEPRADPGGRSGRSATGSPQRWSAAASASSRTVSSGRSSPPRVRRGSADGSEPFNILIAVPPHRAPGFIAASPLAGPNGWIRAAPFSLQRALQRARDWRCHRDRAVAGGTPGCRRRACWRRPRPVVVADNIATRGGGVPPAPRVRGVARLLPRAGIRACRERAKGSLLDRSPLDRVRIRRPARRSHRDKVLFERRSLRQLR